MRHTLALLTSLVALAVPAIASAQQPAIAVTTLAERKVTQLPAGPLAWRLESFPDRRAAEAAAGAIGVVAEVDGRVYLSTLGPAGRSAGGTLVVELGPVPVPAAGEHLLRVSELTGPPGAAAGVHSHPGAELYYVLSGELSVRSATGIARAAAGQGLIGPPSDSAMQPASTGTGPVRALVFFAVDATRPFSSPAQLAEARGAPTQLPRTGAAGGPALVLGAPLVGLVLGAGGLLLRRRSYR